MPFKIEKTNIEGVMIIHPHIAKDNRGMYKKVYEIDALSKIIKSPITECSDLYSNKGVIRGLHYQTECSQAKLLHVVSGSIFDVAVDLRRDSLTFGKWHGELLTEKDHRLFYIPVGFAHGFLALQDNTIFSYACTGKYIPESCGGLRWDDPQLKIPWPLEDISEVILSEKDKNWSPFEEYCMNHKIEYRLKKPSY